MPVIKYQEFIPHAVLQDDVKRFWVLEKDYTPEDSVEEVLPDACVELILNFGAPYIQVSGTSRRDVSKVCLIGLLNKPLNLQASGVVKLVAVRFFAWGALPFLKNAQQPGSPAELELDAAWHPVISQLAAKINRGDYQSAVEDVEDFLIGQRLSNLFDPQQVRAAAKLLYHQKGRFRVAELADLCNLSVRQLQRQFDDATGVSPKTLARTIRFEAIRERLRLAPDANLTDLAYEFGYADQSHFINDFKAFIDKTPGEYAVEMQKFQALFSDNDHVVFLQSPPAMIDYTG